MDERKNAEALETIQRAIGYFYKGEDTTGLLDALWTKTRCFLSLDELEEALIVFGELQYVARSRIGDIAVKILEISGEGALYFENIYLPDEVSIFKKHWSALRLSKQTARSGKRLIF